MGSDSSTQDKMPGVMERIDRVGVENVRTHLKIERAGTTLFHLPLIDVAIDLREDKKGIHMSRIIETINEVVSRKHVDPSLEQVGTDILEGIARRHEYVRGQVIIRTQLLIPRETPASKKRTYESYDVLVKVTRDGELWKYLQITAIGNTLCPHSLDLVGGKAHIQRAELVFGIETDLDADLELQDMADICDSCFSSPTYMVIKGEDERHLVEQMFANPKFVEDLARDCLKKSRTLGVSGKVTIRAKTFESIHKHDAICEIEREI
jgi:GTP cyclohydrolase-4